MGRKLFEEAYRIFWDRLETRSEPRFRLHSYDLCNAVESAEWMPFIAFMVSGELRETINLLNAWRMRLFHLEIWSEVLEKYKDDDVWDIRMHFVEPLAHCCMLEPSATRDRIGQVATNAIHQANLVAIAGYKDVLDQDKLKPGRFLGRREVEKQLEKIGSRWRNSAALVSALCKLDTENHRKATLDYRNQASHFIAPRLETGEVQFVTRQIVPKDVFFPQLAGINELEQMPSGTIVSYGFGGVRPLALVEIIDTNTQEYQIALEVLSAYSELLCEILETMKSDKSS